MTMRRLAVVMLLTVCAGCGHARSFVERLPATTSAMRFLTTPPPTSSAPKLGAAHLAFLSPLVGFVATTGGGYYQQQTGYIPPTEPGLIERTTDGGANWQIVWRGPHVVFDRIVFATSRDGVAVGNLRPQHNIGGPVRPLRPVVLVTDDGGTRWRRIHVPAAVAASALELPAAHAWYAVGRRLLESTDMGRTWFPRSLPRGASLTVFPSATVGYAEAPTSCGKQIWQTVDRGVTWSPLPGTCASSYSSLDFLNQRIGWAATGIRGYDEGSGTPRSGLLIRGTADGGASWTTVYRSNSWLADTRLHFTDARNGWAVSQESAEGAHAHFSLVRRTADRGRSWHTVRYPALPTAFEGSTSAWAGDKSSGLLWRTTDAGRVWSLRVGPEYVWPSALLIANHSKLVIDSAAGTLRSNDGGRTWSSTPPPSSVAVARALHKPAYLRIAATDIGRAIPQLSRDGGRIWRPLQRPKITRYDAGDVAFTDPNHGLLAAGQGEFGADGRAPVFATHDGGKTWQGFRLPPGVKRGDEVTLGPGVVLIRKPPIFYLSTDEGRHWASLHVRDDFWDCAISRPQQDSIWILCSLSVTRAPSLLLRSHDGGSNWRKLSGPVWLDAGLVALNQHEAWAIAKPVSLNPASGRTLWHTTNGGSSWRQVWPNVSGETTMTNRRSFGPHLP
jgi:photosystem II stability/assembly factor-like uncharacterized protein